MKKIFTKLFLLLYVTLSVGLNIIVHTCGGESEALLVTTKVEDPCGCADEMPTDKCCTTVLSTVQLDDAQKASVATIVEQLVVLNIAPVEMQAAHLFHDSGFKSYYISSFSPPLNNDLCIVNSVFLI